jgi:hypothetical protein
MNREHVSQFVDEEIEVEFVGEQPLEKTPRCPNRVIWRRTTFEVQEQLSEWRDYKRKGSMTKNMKPEHSTRTSHVGSWGVGRFYYRVKVNTGQEMELYYDRAPVDADQGKGSWFLLSIKNPLQK